MNIDDALSLIEKERLRQFNLHGMESDMQKSPNDWIATIGSYLCEEASRNGSKPSKEDFQDSLIKTAAVTVAALEHIQVMTENNDLV